VRDKKSLWTRNIFFSLFMGGGGEEVARLLFGDGELVRPTGITSRMMTKLKNLV
jgi:hypothetical protein